MTLQSTACETSAITRSYIQAVNDFFRRSRCSITRLAFYSVNGSDHILIQDSLLFMDTVVCLEVNLYWGDEDILNALASDKFLPNLQHLQLFRFQMDSSQDFLTTIVTPCRRHLRSVKLSCSDPADVESLNERLAQIQQPGQHFIAALREPDDI
ncbi:hypothetical protein F5146DRAFT_520995 [Armillaria mellea]|nr:hypothetical protein F5146DRAFT_520995 [Armillaria mellea]